MPSASFQRPLSSRVLSVPGQEQGKDICAVDVAATSGKSDSLNRSRWIWASVSMLDSSATPYPELGD